VGRVACRRTRDAQPPLHVSFRPCRSRRRRRATRRRAVAGHRSGRRNVDEHLGAAPDGCDEPEAAIVVPLRQGAVDSHSFRPHCNPSPPRVARQLRPVTGMAAP
jgi:hypothetical protein